MTLLQGETLDWKSKEEEHYDIHGKEVSELSGVTIKALHHYHKIGLLQPAEISEAGYRLYSAAELERLRHILFYREMDFPLEQIKVLMKETPERRQMLLQQEKLLMDRADRLNAILKTLRISITSTEEASPWSLRNCSKVLRAKKNGRQL